jgi:hypothetical protein
VHVTGHLSESLSIVVAPPLPIRHPALPPRLPPDGTP